MFLRALLREVGMGVSTAPRDRGLALVFLSFLVSLILGQFWLLLFLKFLKRDSCY